MDQRIEFAMKAMSSSDFAGLCRKYGINRKTRYKWGERFLSHGISLEPSLPGKKVHKNACTWRVLHWCHSASLVCR
jgi:hypothetical protein